MNMQDIKLDEQRAVARQHGEQIGMYLKNVDMPDELKVAIGALLPYLEPAQIEQLHKSLDEQLAFDVMVESDPEYRSKMMELNKQTSGEIDDLLADIENELA